MKKIKKSLIGSILALALIFSTFSPIPAQAATSPTLGAADSFSVIGATGITGTVPTSGITGNVGNPDGGQITNLTALMVGGTIQSFNQVAPATTLMSANVMTDLTAAYGFLDTGNTSCIKASTGLTGTDTGVIELGGKSLAPGVYCTDGSFNITAASTLTLLGTTGTWVFKTATGLSTGVSSSVVGGDPCNVWWRVGSAAAGLGDTSTFIGTIIAHTGITFGVGVTLNGRALAEGANVTLNSGGHISGPICAAPTPTRQPATITVIKNVVNDSGGNKVISDFPLFVNGTRVTSGVIGTFTAPGPAYTITETSNSNYTRKFSGDCDANGQLNLIPGDNKTCVITNNDIGAPAAVVPPLIDLVKTAYPLSLPAGPGTVVYTYTLRNIGTVPVTNITIVGDTCSPIVLTSGDTNHDAKLDLNETWINTCTQVLQATHTNTAVATGWANGISTTDIASATVVVGAPIVPPLIHVIKIPNLFTVPVGGNVTYTYKVTNPGTAPLANVSITDDKCTGLPTQIIGHPGDLNNNNLLENNESWSFTCKSRLYQTTTNIGTARGYANGLMATDLALATVVVYTPKLPTTGFPPKENNTFAVLAGIMAIGVAFYVMRKKQIV